MEIVWLDENIATVPDQPNVQLEFAETADDGIFDTVLGLLLRAAPNKSATERKEK